MIGIFRVCLILFCLSLLHSAPLRAEDVDDDVDVEEEIAEDISLAPSSFTEEQRLKGFSGHRRAAAEFERIRLSGVDEVKRQKYFWNKAMADTLPNYRIAKAKQAAALDEASPEYKEDLQMKAQKEKDRELIRKKYIQARDLARSRQKQAIQLTEEEEYDLHQKLKLVDVNKRALYGAVAKNSKKIDGGKGSGGAPGGSGSFDSGFASPPPPVPQSDFYEPEVPPPPPPPPPMMDGGFDDSIPPPIFDEPEF